VVPTAGHKALVGPIYTVPAERKLGGMAVSEDARVTFAAAGIANIDRDPEFGWGFAAKDASGCVVAQCSGPLWDAFNTLKGLLPWNWRTEQGQAARAQAEISRRQRGLPKQQVPGLPPPLEAIPGETTPAPVPSRVGQTCRRWVHTGGGRAPGGGPTTGPVYLWSGDTPQAHGYTGGAWFDTFEGDTSLCGP